MMDDDPRAPAKKGGRPRVAEPGVSVSAWLRPADYDKIAKAAKAHDVTISALVRSLLRLQIK
jgi:hypothetical protein